LIYEVTCKKEKEKENKLKNLESKDKRHELSV
jgi:hypothetical protein